MLLELLARQESSKGRNGKTETHGLNGRSRFASPDNGNSPPFSEAIFTKLLRLERRRAERSRQPFALMLIDASKLPHPDRHNNVPERLADAISSSTRETDICGWYAEGSVLGVILTEIGSADVNVLRKTMLSKVLSALHNSLGTDHKGEIHISFHVFPDNPGPQNGNGGSAGTKLDLYPDLQPENDRKRGAKLLKRAIDVAGSIMAVALLSPIFLAIAVAIKLTSKGPILFKQKRIGQYGVEFTFLKFRSMYFLNDPKIHQEYVRKLIGGKDDCKQADGNGGAYKLQDDPRITPLGKFLRRTSLDELPQFINVLRGDMSLVGPRPPLPYETEVYDIWHRRRFFEIKPGITGLWQVKGRSKVKFDDMVRLDIQYMKNWSLGLDLKILLATPRAMFLGKGAC